MPQTSIWKYVYSSVLSIFLVLCRRCSMSQQILKRKIGINVIMRNNILQGYRSGQLQMQAFQSAQWIQIFIWKIEKVFFSIIGWLYIVSIYVSTLKIYKKHSVELYLCPDIVFLTVIIVKSNYNEYLHSRIMV